MAMNVPTGCPGVGTKSAGSSAACAGCPNQTACASGVAPPQDPAIADIAGRLANVALKIVVMSGKGGVGKSTVTAALAHSIARDKNNAHSRDQNENSAKKNELIENLEIFEKEEAEDNVEVEEACVGVLDIDITGPSIPRILGCAGATVHNTSTGWAPVPVPSDAPIVCMSVGFLLPNPDEAVVWRGPKKTAMVRQFLRDVNWGDLAALVIDTPPGTSDEHISLVQLLAEAGIDGAVLVTTPQEVSLQDVRKELAFCRKAGVRVLGVIENMSGFVCPNCSHCSEIFAASTGGAEKMCKDQGIPFLGRIPIDPRITLSCDAGQPFIGSHPGSLVSKAYADIVCRLYKEIERN